MAESVFPAIVHQHAPVYADHHGEHLMIRNGHHEQHPNFETWKKVDPFDAFAMQSTELGCTIVPVQIRGTYFRDARGRIAKLLGMGKLPREYELVNTPLADGMYAQRNITMSPGILLIPEKENHLPDCVQSMQGLQIDRMRLCMVQNKEMYRMLRTVSDCPHPHWKIREAGDAHGTLAWMQERFPELGKKLEEYGNVVYESGPADADRVLIGFKHFHGSMTSLGEFMAIGNEGTDAFLRHRRRLRMLLTDFLHGEQKGRMKYFGESLPVRVNEEYARGQRETWDFMLRFRDRDIEEATALLRRGVADERALPAFLHSILDADARIVPELESEGRSDIVFGDGRYERQESDDEEKRQERLKMIELCAEAGSIGVAGGIRRIDEGHVRRVAHAPHRQLTMSAASTLRRGEIGLVPYGGYHFRCGTESRSDPHVLGMEKYFSYLPRTHVIIMEDRDIPIIVDAKVRVDEYQKGLSPELWQLQDQARKAMNMCCEMGLVQLADKATEIPASEILQRFLESAAVLRMLYANLPAPSPQSDQRGRLESWERR